MKLPQILAEGDVPIPGRTSGYADSAGEGYLAAARGIERFGAAAVAAGQAYLKAQHAAAEVERRKQDVLARQESAAAEAAFEAGIATYNEDLKLTERDPDIYEAKLKTRSDEMFTEALKGLKTDPGKALLTARRKQIMGRFQVEARKHGNALYKDRGIALLEQTTADLVVKAGLTPFDDVATHTEIQRRGLAAIQTGVALEGAEKAGERSRTFRQSLQAEQARRHRDLDPESFITQADARYPLMAPTQRDAFKDYAVKEVERRKERAVKREEDYERKAAAAFERERDQMIVELEQSASRGELTLAQLDTRIGLRQVKSDEGIRIRKMILQGPDEPPSHGPTLDRFLTDVHSMRPRTKDEELTGARDAGRLNRKDYVALKNRLRETQKDLMEKGETEAFRQYNQAEQELRTAIGIRPGLLAEAMKDDPASRIYAALLPELRERAWPTTGKEKALTVVKELAERGQRALGNAAKLKATEIRGLLLYSTPRALEEARTKGLIGDAAYAAQRRLFLDPNYSPMGEAQKPPEPRPRQ